MPGNHHMIMKKEGGTYHRYILTGNGLINVDRIKDIENVPSSVVENKKPAKITTMLESKVIPEEPEPTTKEDVLSEINKRFSAFTAGDAKPKMKKTRFRLK